MKLNANIYPDHACKDEVMMKFILVVNYTATEGEEAPVFDFFAAMRKHALAYNAEQNALTPEVVKHFEIVAGRCYQEFRSVMIKNGLWDHFYKGEAKNRRKKRNLPFRLERKYVKYKRGVLEITGNTPECLNVRDEIFNIKTYSRTLDLPTAKESLDALWAYVDRDKIKFLEDSQKLQGLRDFATQYIDLKKRKFSYHTIRAYKRVIRNLTMFCEKFRMHDHMNLMTKDDQSAFFSKYVDFLLEEAKDSTTGKVLKKPYTNATVKDEFKLISALSKAFDDLHVRVDLTEFVDSLREGNLNMPYCSYEEVVEIYRASHSLDLTLQQEKACDLFLFQCFTGLRYSELYEVEQANITLKMYSGTSFHVLNYVSEKTGQENTVPLNDTCMAIITKWKKRPFVAPQRRDWKLKEDKIYSNCCLPVLNISQANLSIKEVLQKIPLFHSKEKIVRFSGDKKIETYKHRYEMITTHSARHTYSAFLTAQGLSLPSVSKLLNHSSVDTTDKHYKHLQNDRLEYEAFEILNKKMG